MAKLTEAEVHAAAAALDAQGVKPTTAKVREKLGRGSFSTIQEMMTTYEGTAKDTSDDSETPAELESLLPIIWSKCEAIARERFEAEKAELEKRVKDLEEENKALERIIDDQDSAIDYRDNEITGLKILSTKCEEETDKLKEKIAYLKGVIDGKKDQAKKSQIKKDQVKKPAIRPNLETTAVPGMEA